jgi:probable HAF family extracellular repeat protein
VFVRWNQDVLSRTSTPLTPRGNIRGAAKFVADDSAPPNGTYLFASNVRKGGEMKSRTLTCTTSLIIFATAVLTPLTAQVQYTVTDLGGLGGSFSAPNTINNLGQVAGSASLPGDEVGHAFFWSNGKITDLGTLGGPVSVGAGINESGEVVVGADTSLFGGLRNTICATEAICRMFLWRKGVRVVPDLGTLEGGTDTGIYDIVSFGLGTSMINNRRQVIGQADIPVFDPNLSDPPVAISRAFLWEKGAMTDLGVLGEGHDAFANAINDEGQVVGASQYTASSDPVLQFPPPHTFLWQKGTMTDLGAFPGAKISNGLGINNAGQVVGLSTVRGDNDFHAALWSGGVLTDLGVFPGDTDSVANAINSRGQIVGASGSPTTLRAMIWENDTGIDLNTRIAASSGWQLLIAIDINDRGQITGFGIHNNPNGQSAFLLTPIANPHTNDRPGRSASTIRGTFVEKKGMTLRQLFRRRLGGRISTNH